MAEHTPDALVQQIDPLGDSSIRPSQDRIRQLALQKRREYLNKQEEKPMKKVTFRVVLVAALICLVSASAFALSGGLQYMQHIFGDSVNSVESAVLTPQITASGGGRTMELEALLSDGFVTDMILSLSGETPPQNTEALFSVSSDSIQPRSIVWNELEAFSSTEKTMYRVELVTEKRFDAAAITLSLQPDIAPISMQIDVQSKLGNAVVDFPDGAMSGETKLVQLQLSSLGLLLIGQESDARGGLPSTDMQLVFADGTTESVQIEFAPSDELVGGGGGAVIDDGEVLPLVVSFDGNRNPDGELVVSAEFSRVIQPGNLKSVAVDGIEYPVN